MTGRGEWDVYAELGRAGIERARAALAEASPPELSPPAPVRVATPNEDALSSAVPSAAARPPVPSCGTPPAHTKERQ